MAIPADTARIVFNGKMPNGEIWSTGFWVHGGVPTSAGEANALAELAFDEFLANDDSGAMRISIEDLMNAATSLTDIKAYCYPTGGPTAPYIGDYVLPTAKVGTVGGHLPNQVAIVLTLRTGIAGRRHRGRMYLPMTGLTMAADGQVAQTDLATQTDAWALAFSDWNAADTPKIVVVSQVGTAYTPVTSVTMDSRADVQRSRAASEAILRRSVGALS